MKRLIRVPPLSRWPMPGTLSILKSRDEFNQAVDQFLTQVRSGRWPVREAATEAGGPFSE
ncbi:MAG: hypothetical protein Ct9H300mP16_00040 [Pseudomonadota bacterium]|nr:MAG: hypothetical protein Ct9H300mP16_00040 [Pseudomonadota bacterium]